MALVRLSDSSRRKTRGGVRESLSRVTETREGRDYVESQGAGPGSRRATSASSASRRAAPDLAAPRAPPLGSPHSLSRPSPPGSLKSPRTEMGVTTPGTSGNKTQRRPRGGRGEGEEPRNQAGRAGPHSPASPRPHSPAPESAPWPSAALQSRLGTAAARVPRAAPLRVSRTAPATRRVRPRGPSRGIGAKEPQPLSRLPGTPGPGTTTPSRVRDTNARGNGGSRGTNAPSRLV